MRKTLLLILFTLIIAGCASPVPIITPGDPAITQTATVIHTATPTETPSPTPIALAAMVNGQPITLPEFQSELKRFLASSIEIEGQNASKIVLEVMVSEMLLLQGAERQGFTPSDEEITNRIQALEVDEAEFLAWMEDYDYTDETLLAAMKQFIKSNWMTEYIAEEVPSTAEQVYAYQIRVDDLPTAEGAFGRLNEGEPFLDLAWEYDGIAGGFIGWFPYGYLTQPTLNDVAFSLEVGEYSDIIKTEIGYHILYVDQREVEQLLSPGAREMLQKQAITNWLAEQRSLGDIVVYLNLDSP